MSKRVRRDRIGIPADCIFCERKLSPSLTLSGEHLFSKWMRGFLPRPTVDGRREQMLSFNFNRRVGQIEFWNHNGAARHAKLHVVCSLCNNRWMSVLDSNLRDIAGPLIEGTPTILSPEMQTMLARWLVMKLLVFENAPKVGQPGSPIFAQSFRTKFMRDQEIADGFTMWLAPGGGPMWSEAVQLQSSGLLLSRTRFSLRELGKRTPLNANIQTMTWGVGRVVFSIVAVSDPKLYGIDWQAPTGHTQLWPLAGGSILFPTNFALTDWEIGRISLRHHGPPGQAMPIAFRPGYGPQQPR